jgi:hypothetical protein
VLLPKYPDVQADQALIDEFVELAAKLRLRDVELAAATGLSAPTVRIVRLTRVAPSQQRCVVAIRSFVDRNRAARDRGDIRLAS